MKYAVIGVALLLGACATVPGGNIVSQIQSTAQSICRFVPTARTVIDIIAAGDGIAQSTSAIATAICSALEFSKINADQPGGNIPRVNGVRVRGSYT